MSSKIFARVRNHHCDGLPWLKSNLQNKQWKGCLLSKQTFIFVTWDQGGESGTRKKPIETRVQGGALWSTRKKIQDRSICFFQIWRACGGCGSPWKVSKGSSNTGAACNQHKQKNKFWRLWQPGLNDERSRCLTAPLWPYAASTPAMHYASVVTKTAAMIRFN